MNFSTAFDNTLTRFGIKAKEIAAMSGVTESSISRFRRGELDVKASSLERLLRALPQDAQQYLLFQLLVSDMDRSGIATLLSAIAFRLKESDEKSGDTSAQASEPILSLR